MAVWLSFFIPVFESYHSCLAFLHRIPRDCGAVAQSVERPKGPSLVKLFWHGFETHRSIGVSKISYRKNNNNPSHAIREVNTELSARYGEKAIVEKYTSQSGYVRASIYLSCSKTSKNATSSFSESIIFCSACDQKNFFVPSLAGLVCPPLFEGILIRFWWTHTQPRQKNWPHNQQLLPNKSQ